MTDAFSTAYQELQKKENTPLVIIVTDGAPDNTYTATEQADRLKNNGIKIAAIGAGSVDHKYLATLATSPGDYYPISDMSGLQAAFKNIVNGLRLHK